MTVTAPSTARLNVDVLLTTRDIAVYAAVVGTISGVWSVAWSIYSGLLRDRARVKLVVYDAEAWDENFEHAFDAVMFAVYNRGRRPVYLSDMVRVKSVWRGVNEVSLVLQRQVKDAPTLEEGRGQTYRIGGHGDYTHGQLSLKRWHVVDEAGRIFPLRERYRQRVERFVLWPVHKVFRWKERHAAPPTEENDDYVEV